jgi:SAM-dependent methyltransferase
LIEVSGFDRALCAPNEMPHELPTVQALAAHIPSWALTLTMTGAERGNVLDFGCGSGAAGFAAELLGCTPYFVDNRPEVLDGLVALGVQPSRVATEIAANWPLFDIIILGDVIEHFADPEGLLHYVLDHLNPNCTLLVSTPDADSPIFRGLGLANPYFGEIEHYHTFSRQSLLILADKCGLSLITRFPNQRYLAGLDWVFAARFE